MTTLFGGAQASKATEYTGIQVQRSVQGACLPIIVGTVRAGDNLIWYGDFKKTGGTGGGKGGVTGSKTGSNPATYAAACALGLCEGPIIGINAVWADKSLTNLSTLGLSLFIGNYPQTPWGYLTTNHAAQALGYNGIAYVAAQLYNLGTSAQLPNHTFEIAGFHANSITGQVDADPSLVVSTLLTNPHFGAGFPADSLGDLTEYQNYCVAQGLLISTCYAAQAPCSNRLEDLAQATNSEIVWDGALLTLRPYGDSAVTGNGKTFTPNLAPVFNLTADDTVGQEPVKWFRKRPADQFNSIKVQYANRNQQYVPDAVELKDQALIDRAGIGLRQAPVAGETLFALPSAAYQSAQLRLQRQAIMNTCEFVLDARYAVLVPMDIVTVPDPVTAAPVLVRIKSVEQDGNDNLQFKAEEILLGTGTAYLNAFEQTGGFIQDYNVPPASVNTPIIFEPDVQLLTQRSISNPQIWFALSGGTGGVADPRWGGCNAWVSLDNVTYTQFGTVHRPAAMGVLTANLAAYGGGNPDVTNTLSVDLTMSNGPLVSVSDTEASNGVSLCLVDNEFLSYVNATLTAANRYDLTRLYRAMYGSNAPLHSTLARFALLDSAILAYSLPVPMIGMPLYFKFPSFNIYNQALQSLASATAYPYTPVGSGYFGPQAQAISAGTALLDWGLLSDSPGLSNDDWGLITDPYPFVVDMGVFP